MDECILPESSSAYVIKRPTYIIAQGIQITISLATIVLVLCWRPFITKQFLNKNSITLMNYILLSILLHAVIFAGTQIHHIVYDFIFAQTQCDYLFTNFTCMFVKIFTQCFNINLPLLFICLCIERTVATASLQNYTESTTIVFRLLPVLSSGLSIGAATLVYYVDADDSLNSSSCLFTTLAAWNRVNAMYYSLVGINVTSVVWMFGLYLQNRRLELGISNSITPFTSRYQIKENLHITKTILLCGSIQLIITLCHESANLIRRSLSGIIDTYLYRELAVFSYLITYANLAFIIALYYLLQRQLKAKRNIISRDINTRKENSASGYFTRYAW